MTRFAYALVMAAIAAPTTSAEAGVFELDAQIQTGLMGGTGFSGDRKDEAFAKRTRGFGYGALVGVEFLFIDSWIEHNQYYDDGVHGTWTQFMLGLDINADIGGKKGPPPVQGKKDDRISKGFVEIGVAVGFGVGTGAQVDPPLDKTEVTDRGFVGQLQLDFGYRINKVMSIGVHIPIQAGYLFRAEDPAGDPANANDLSNHYGSISGAALLTMRANFSLTD
jgi:hypothetical protein